MLKLLIVDDEVIERNALKFIMAKHCPDIGEIEEAANGREAIAKASSFNPDIIFMDIKMPGINGIEAARSIKLQYPHFKIIFFTAFDYFDYAQEAIKIGAEDLVIKPSSDEQIIKIVNNLIEKIRWEKINTFRQREAETKLELAIKYLETELVSSMVAGCIDDSHIKEYLAILGMEFIHGFCAVAEIDYELHGIQVLSQMQKNIMKKRCMEKIKASINNSGFNCIVGHSANTIYIIIMIKSGDRYEECSKELCTKLMSNVQKSIFNQQGIDINIGIGCCTDNISGISYSFFQAKSASKYKIGQNIVTHYIDMEESSNISRYPVEKEKQLFEKVIRCDLSSAIVIADELIDWITLNYDSQEDITRKIYELIVVVYRMVLFEGRISIEVSSDFYNNLRMLNNNFELKTYFKNRLKELIETIESESHYKAAFQLEKVCNHINNNYIQEITLEEMASMAGMSSYYFSKIFKQHMKINFIEYLTKIRVRKAKEYLENPSVSIKDISGLVGYSSPDYFTRVFKRIQGISPSEYRCKKMIR